MMMQHGNFFATSAIWTDFIRRIARRASRKKKSDYFNQFQGSSVMLHGGAVGAETEEEVLLQWAADLIFTFQVLQRKVDKRIKASQWQKNQYFSSLSEQILLPSNFKVSCIAVWLGFCYCKKKKKKKTALNCSQIILLSQPHTVAL